MSWKKNDNGDGSSLSPESAPLPDTVQGDETPQAPQYEYEDRLAVMLEIQHQRIIAGEKMPDHQASGESESSSADLAIADELESLGECLRRLEYTRREAVAHEASAYDRTLALGVSHPIAQHNSDTDWIGFHPSPGDSTVDTEREPVVGRIGRFEIIRELGRGGLGVVLLAYDPVLRRQVALKIPRPEALLSSDLRRRFLREAHAAARLTHPNIVPVFEVGTAGPMCFIAAAYVDGPNLAQWLQERGASCAARAAAELVAELADGMQYAHTQGVLHRDLKPGNVLLEPRILTDGVSTCSPDVTTWTPKVTDFGLAKLMDMAGPETRTGAVIGTPAYMSPEQATGSVAQLGPASDIYSLGAILYELLAGHPPFRGNCDADTLTQVTSQDPIPLRRIQPELSCDLEAICLRCLEKQSARRYATAGDLATDLRRYLANQPTMARPLSAQQRLARWAQRRPAHAALVTLATAAIMALAAGVAFHTWRLDRALRLAEENGAQAQAAEQAAEAQAAMAGQVSNFLVELFQTADPLGMGRLGFRQPQEIGENLTLRELLDRGSRQAQKSLKDQPRARAKLLDTLGKVYSNLGLLAQAEPLVREAYEIRQTQPENDRDLATSLLNMGVLERWKGEYAEAERLLRQAIEIHTRLDGPDSLPTVEAEFALAWTIGERDSFVGDNGAQMHREFTALLDHVLKVQRRELGANHRDVGMTMTLLLLRNFALGKREEAERLLLPTLAIFMQQDGGQPVAQGALDAQRAGESRRNRDFAKAERFYRSGLNHMEPVLGKKHIATLALQADLAGLLRDMGRMVEYEQLGNELVKYFREIYPQGHPMFFEGVGEWTYFIASQGKFDEVIEILEILEQVDQRFRGRSTQKAMSYKLQVASYRLQQGRLDEADRLVAEVEQWLTEAGERDPELTNLSLSLRGGIAGARGDLAEQERLYRECFRRSTSSPPPVVEDLKTALAAVIHEQRPHDPETITLLLPPDISSTQVLTSRYQHVLGKYLAYARMLIDRGQLDEAEPYVNFASEFAHHKTMPGCYLIGQADTMRGALLAARGQWPEAETQLRAAIDNLCQTRHEHHPLTQDAVRRLADVYRQTGRNAEAAALFKR